MSKVKTDELINSIGGDNTDIKIFDDIRQITIWDKDSIVIKGNPLITSKMTWPLNAQKILLLLASSPEEFTDKDGNKNVKDSERLYWQMPAHLLADQIGVERLHSRYLKELAHTMASTTIEINLPSDTKDGEPSWSVEALVPRASYNNGIFSVKVSETCKEQLGRLASGYTQYALKNVIRMKSQYSIRLYELISSELYKYTKTGEGEVTYEIDEFRDLMGLHGKKTYQQFNRLKEKIIEPAISEINYINRDNIRLILYKNVLGNKVESVTFAFINKALVKEKANDMINKLKYEYDTNFDMKKITSIVNPIPFNKALDWEYYYKLALGVIDQHRESYKALKSMGLNDNYIVYNYLAQNYIYTRTSNIKYSFEGKFLASIINDHANALNLINITR